jgi:glyoxylase-like metal-dependent hydrolase (beta-lactamase superfamily II)
MPQSKIELRVRSVGPWPMNSYALVCLTTRESMLIDPGADPDTLQEMLTDTRPVGILITHTHPDHIGALDEMRSRLNVPVMAHPGPHFEGLALRADLWLNHGDGVRLGEHRLRVYHTPGHTGDIICAAIEGDERIVIGDTIFEGGPGKTESAEDFSTTLQTLREIVLAWPDDTVCYPGHGPHFRLGDKRAAIEAFLDKDHGEFFGDATWEM